MGYGAAFRHVACSHLYLLEGYTLFYYFHFCGSLTFTHNERGILRAAAIVWLPLRREPNRFGLFIEIGSLSQSRVGVTVAVGR